MIYQARCGKCRSRKTLQQDPGEYLEWPRCSCGGKLYLDRHRQTGKEGKAAACRCEGFPWAIDNAPHRKGSASPSNGWYCVYAPLSPC